MRLPLTSTRITNETISEALVGLLGKATDREVELVFEGEWKLFDKRQHRLRREA